MPQAVRMKGTVLTARPDKGFVFLREDVSGQKYFGHASAFVNYDDIYAAIPGRLVTFEEGPSEGREYPRAQRVKLLS